jgi:cytochrome P450
MAIRPEPSRPRALELSSIPLLGNYGYAGGRDSFQAFCTRVFLTEEPRFLRTGDDMLVVFRHGDLRALAARAELAVAPPAMLFPHIFAAPPSDARRPGQDLAEVISNQAFTTNPPINPALRRVLLNQIGPRPMARLAPTARRIAIDILARTSDGEEIDLVSGVAEPLAARFWAELIGMSREEAADAALAVRDMTPMLWLERTEAGNRDADAAAGRYRAVVETAAMRSLRRGGWPFVDDMAADLARVDLEDDLAYAGLVPKTVGAFLAGNLFDGFHTAAHAAANTINVLLRHPQALDLVQAAPERMDAAVAEALRLEPPVIHLQRYASADLVHDGLIIPAGVKCLMMWGAGNRDPSAFPGPDRFELDRPRQGATTFGGGAHICPGRFAAAMLSRELVAALTMTSTALEPVLARDDWFDNLALSQLRRMPVTVVRGQGNRH